MLSLFRYNVSMIRTQIQLPEELHSKLHEIAAGQSRSMAACIRDAINEFVRQAETSSGDDLSDIAGKFRPLPADEIEPHDQVWADVAIEGRRLK